MVDCASSTEDGEREQFSSGLLHDVRVCSLTRRPAVARVSRTVHLERLVTALSMYWAAAYLFTGRVR